MKSSNPQVALCRGEEVAARLPSGTLNSRTYRLQLARRAAAGAETSLVTVVTNTKHVEEGEIVVVALPGATVPVSKTVEEGATVVEKSSVGGRKSGGSELRVSCRFSFVV